MWPGAGRNVWTFGNETSLRGHNAAEGHLAMPCPHPWVPLSWGLPPAESHPHTHVPASLVPSRAHGPLALGGICLKNMFIFEWYHCSWLWWEHLPACAYPRFNVFFLLIHPNPSVLLHSAIPGLRLELCSRSGWTWGVLHSPIGVCAYMSTYEVYACMYMFVIEYRAISFCGGSFMHWY